MEKTLNKNLNKSILKRYGIKGIGHSNNKYFGTNIFINKPVFKKNENIIIHWFIYNILTKNPIWNDFTKNLLLEIKDLSNSVKYSKIIKYDSNNENIINYENNLNDGFYKINISYNDELIDKINFLIQNGYEKNMTLSINWNKEFINKNDEIIGDISLDAKSIENIVKKMYTYNIFNNEGVLLLEKKNLNLDKESKINFISPNNEFNYIIIKIKFNLDGFEQDYTKTLYYYNDSIFNINYYFESVNPIPNKDNKVYLKIIKNINMSNIPINTKFEILKENKIIYNDETIIDGRGNFIIKSLKLNYNYYIRVHNFKIKLNLNLNKESFLKPNKKIYNYGDNFNVQLGFKKKKYEDIYFGIHNNSKFIYSTIIDKYNLDFNLLEGFEKGGIFDIILFKMKGNDFEILIKNIIFIKPKEIWKINFNFNNNNNQIFFDLLINNNLVNDDIFLNIKIYEDNLLNYIDENKREQNLITKIFLTNKSEYDNIEFNYSKFYDFLKNDNNDDNLELYLGTIYNRLIQNNLLFYEKPKIKRINKLLRFKTNSILKKKEIKLPKKQNNNNNNNNNNKEEEVNDCGEIKIFENENRICYQKGIFKINNDTFKDSFKIYNRNLLYRVEVTAISKNGIYGFDTFNVSIKNDIDVFIKYPNFIYNNHEFEISFSIKNNLQKQVFIKLFNLENFIIEKNEIKNIIYNMKIDNLNLVFNKISKEIIINYSYDQINKVYKETIYLYLITKETVISKNYWSVLNNSNNSIKISDFIDFSNNLFNLVKLKISTKKDSSDLIIGIVKNMIKDPHGCFEQMSSVTFPMAIAYNILLKFDENNKNIYKLKNSIYKKINKNLKKLLSFENKYGGFGIFSGYSSSFTLTAFGLLQFKFLNNMGFKLNKLIERNIKWLLNININLKNNNHSKFRFYIEAPLLTKKIYSYWVISEISPYELKNIELNLDKVKSDDSYIQILIGLIYFNIGDFVNYELICNKLENKMENDYIKGSLHSITLSFEQSKLVETNSLFILLQLKKHNQKKLEYIEKAIKYIYSKYSKGYFITTQGTVLSLIAINEYLKIKKLRVKEGIIDIKIEDYNNKIDLKNMDDDNNKDIILYQDNLIYTENKNIDIDIINKTENYDLNALIETNITYYKNLEIEDLNYKNNNYFKLNILKIKEENNISFFNIIYENLKDEHLGMANIEFKFSNNYEINHNDLSNLKKIGEIDFYEISEFNDKIIFYFSSIKKRERKILKFSLLKIFNNNENNNKDFSCMYLFYGKEESIVYNKIENPAVKL